jgi:hypothetical protein
VAAAADPEVVIPATASELKLLQEIPFLPKHFVSSLDNDLPRIIAIAEVDENTPSIIVGQIDQAAWTTCTAAAAVMTQEEFYKHITKIDVANLSPTFDDVCSTYNIQKYKYLNKLDEQIYQFE